MFYRQAAVNRFLAYRWLTIIQESEVFGYDGYDYHPFPAAFMSSDLRFETGRTWQFFIRVQLRRDGIRNNWLKYVILTSHDVFHQEVGCFVNVDVFLNLGEEREKRTRHETWGIAFSLIIDLKKTAFDLIPHWTWPENSNELLKRIKMVLDWG